MPIEFAYLSRENTIDLLLKSNDSAVDLSGTTAMNLKLGSHLVTSTNSTSDISWNGVGYATGEARLHLGNLSTLTAGIYDGFLAAFDASTPNGVVWGPIALEIKSDPLAT
jgi:hypothetical protein